MTEQPADLASQTEPPRKPDDGDVGKAAREIARDVELLSYWIEQLGEDLRLMEESWRWKLGNGLGKLAAKLGLIRRPPRLATDDVREVLQTYRSKRDAALRRAARVRRLCDERRPSAPAAEAEEDNPARASQDDEKTDPTHKSSVQPRATLLYIYHSGKGGSILASQDLLERVELHYRCLVLRSSLNEWELHSYQGGKSCLEKTFRFSREWQVDRVDDEERISALREIREQYDVRLAHVRHLLGYEASIIPVLREQGCGVIFSFHDFYAVCPTIQLIDNHDRYCAGHCTEGAGQCRLNASWITRAPALKHAFVHQWRKNMGKGIRQCDALVTTSAAARSVIVDHFGFLDDDRFKVIEHGRDMGRYRWSSVAPAGSSPVRIVYFGALDHSKGTALVSALLRHVLTESLDYEIHVLGQVFPGFDPQRLGAICHGPYDREDLPDLLAEIQPSFSLAPSLWPETYCHVLTESWAAGIPVLASDLGTLRERVHKSGGGWLLDPHEPGDWIDTLARVRANEPEYEQKRVEIREMKFRSVDEMARRYLELYHEVLALNSSDKSLR